MGLFLSWIFLLQIFVFQNTTSFPLPPHPQEIITLSHPGKIYVDRQVGAGNGGGGLI